MIAETGVATPEIGVATPEIGVAIPEAADVVIPEIELAKEVDLLVTVPTGRIHAPQLSIVVTSPMYLDNYVYNNFYFRN